MGAGNGKTKYKMSQFELGNFENPGGGSQFFKMIRLQIRMHIDITKLCQGGGTLGPEVRLKHALILETVE